MIAMVSIPIIKASISPINKHPLSLVPYGNADGKNKLVLNLHEKGWGELVLSL